MISTLCSELKIRERARHWIIPGQRRSIYMQVRAPMMLPQQLQGAKKKDTAISMSPSIAITKTSMGFSQLFLHAQNDKECYIYQQNHLLNSQYNRMFLPTSFFFSW
jgi:hypothetical protein